MREANRVPHLMRPELTQPGQRGRDGVVRIARAGEPGTDERLENDHVLARAKRPKNYGTLDDFAGARIVDRIAVGPAAGCAVNPVDDIVADVERVGAGG